MIFTNNLITTLLGIFPHEIGKKRAFFTLGLGPKKCSPKITESRYEALHERMYIINLDINVMLLYESQQWCKG
jgi:hypothetical protein